MSSGRKLLPDLLVGRFPAEEPGTVHQLLHCLYRRLLLFGEAHSPSSGVVPSGVVFHQGVLHDAVPLMSGFQQVALVAGKHRRQFLLGGLPNQVSGGNLQSFRVPESYLVRQGLPPGVSCWLLGSVRCGCAGVFLHAYLQIEW